MGRFHAGGIQRLMDMSLHILRAMLLGTAADWRMTWPKSFDLLAASAPIWGRFLRRATAMFVTCSYQCTPRIRRWHLTWKACNRHKFKLVIVHVSEAYRSTGKTRDMYRRSLVMRVRCDWLHKCGMLCIVLAATFPPPLRRYPVCEPLTELSWLPRYVKFYPFHLLSSHHDSLRWRIEGPAPIYWILVFVHEISRPR